MRRVTRLLVVSTILVSGAVIGAGAGPAAGAAVPPGQGVTATTIRIGIPYIDLSAIRQFGITLDQGNYPDAYNAIIADLNARGAKIVISQHPRRARSHPLDEEMYKWRHLIENFFCKLKEFKRIAMRADKTDTSFAAIINLAAAVINSR